MARELFLFAGEHSADLHGAELIKALKKQEPTLHIFGVGGPRMRAEGLECIMPMEKFQVMGFIDVLFALPRIIVQFYQLRRMILQRSPAVALFIDYPGFNLRMERSLRKKDFPGKICHYICPSVWAWGKKRIPLMAKTLDLLLTVFPFEKALFANTPLRVEYIGHPLVKKIAQHEEAVAKLPAREKSMILTNPCQNPQAGSTSGGGDILEKVSKPPLGQGASKGRFCAAESFATASEPRPLNLPKGKTIIAIFPGSRRKEIERNFPVQVKVARRLSALHPDLFFAISVAHEQYLPLLHQHPLPNSTFVPAEQAYDLMAICDAAMAKSGTVTLELALHKVPTVVTYGITPLDLFIAQHIFKINLPFYALPNIIADTEVFPELFGPHLTEDNLFVAMEAFLTSEEQRNRCQLLCSQVRTLLQDKDAAAEAARFILEFL